jgi:hypothetical protein
MNTIIVPISNEPNFGFKRTASMAALQINALPFVGENINLLIQIDYFENETDNPISIIPPKNISLLATGEEFEYYMGLFNEPVIIRNLVIAKIQEADQQHKFD